MTFYQRLCGMNYPTVLVVLWSAGAFSLLFGFYTLLWGMTIVGRALVTAGAALIAVPFVLKPWA